MAQSAQDYYNNDKGGYQYLKLSEIIDGFILESHDSENWLYALPRHIIVKNAKDALKELHRSAAKDFKAIEISLGDDYSFALPQDYVDYLRVSVITKNNTLAPLDINTNLNVATAYLQDNDYNLLFDNEGNILESDGNNLTNRPYNSFTVKGTGNGGAFQADTSKLSKHGEFIINEREGVMYFGTSLAGESIVLEYVSDGVDWERIKETEITFHKHLEGALKDLVYYKCVERRRNVPANEKDRASRRAKTSRHEAKIKLANFDLQAIERVWRKGLKWVKS